MDSHKIQPVDLTFNDSWSIHASAKTVDGTQFKRAYTAIGERLFKVERRYLVETEWRCVYNGNDVDRAVEVYNGLG